ANTSVARNLTHRDGSISRFAPTCSLVGRPLILVVSDEGDSIRINPFRAFWSRHHRVKPLRRSIQPRQHSQGAVVFAETLVPGFEVTYRIHRSHHAPLDESPSRGASRLLSRRTARSRHGCLFWQPRRGLVAVWIQRYDPLGHWLLSTAFAALPVFL